MFEKHLDYPVFDADNHLFDSVMFWRSYAEPKYAELFEDEVWLSDRDRFLSSAIGRRVDRFEEGNEATAPNGQQLSTADEQEQARVAGLQEAQSREFRPGASLQKLNPYKNAKSAEEARGGHKGIPGSRPRLSEPRPSLRGYGYPGHRGRHHVPAG